MKKRRKEDEDDKIFPAAADQDCEVSISDRMQKSSRTEDKIQRFEFEVLLARI